MKKTAILLLLLLITLSVNTVLAVEPSFSGERGILLFEEASGRVLYAQNQGKKFYPASTTKIMTALIVLENMNLEDEITVGGEIKLISSDSSKADLVEGEVLSVKELLYALMLPSGNDAAYTLARGVGNAVGKVEDQREAIDYFVQMMNNKAKEMGAAHTHFENPHGLHSDNHYTTLEDMLLMTKELLKHEIASEIVKSTSYSVATPFVTHKWYNTNYLLHPILDQVSKGLEVGKNPYYTEDVKGIKTGNTGKAGKCLVFSSFRDDQELIGILYKSTDEKIWSEAIELLDYAEDEYEYTKLLEANGKIDELVLDNAKSIDKTRIIVKKDLIVLIGKEEKEHLETQLIYDENLLEKTSEGTYVLKENISLDQVIGQTIYSFDGKEISKADLYSGSSLKVRTLLDYLFYIEIIIAIAMVFLIIYYLRKIK